MTVAYLKRATALLGIALGATLSLTAASSAATTPHHAKAHHAQNVHARVPGPAVMAAAPASPDPAVTWRYFGGPKGGAWRVPLD